MRFALAIILAVCIMPPYPWGRVGHGHHYHHYTREAS